MVAVVNDDDDDDDDGGGGGGGGGGGMDWCNAGEFKLGLRRAGVFQSGFMDVRDVEIL